MNLQNIKVSEIETTYEQFYKTCSGFPEAQLVTLTKDILTWNNHQNPVVRSYSLLFLGAIIDNGTPPESSVALIVNYLSKMLTTLTDFRVSDGESFIHTISHATFLAESLRPKTPQDFSAEILSAFFRNTEMFDFNEDITVGQYLLSAHPKAFVKSLQVIQQTSLVNPHDIKSRAKSANVKSLWLTMYALNKTQHLQPESVFDDLMAGVLQHAIE